MNKSLSGQYAALLSGFTDDGALDEQRQNAIVDYAIKQDIQGLYVGGSSGESAFMSVDELKTQQNMVYARVKSTENTQKLIAHVGMPNLRDSICLAKNAASLGYDALSALPPHAVPFTQSEIHNYYDQLSSATDLPLIVYEVPFRTGKATPIADITKLLSLKNVAGIKFTSADIYALSRIAKHNPDTTIFFGSDEMYAPAACLGVDGGIGTTYNVLGSLYSGIQKASLASDVAEMRRLQFISQDFVEIILDSGVIPGTKQALQAIGVDCGPARLPLELRGEDSKQRIAEFMQREDVKPWLAS